MKGLKQVLLGVVEGIALFVLIFLLFVAYGSINNRWYRLLVVTSGSMSPTINAGDMILVTPAPLPENLQPGMIVSFRTRGGKLVTHRIVAIATDGRVITKGDANEETDVWRDGDEEYKFIRVGGLYRGRLPYLGYPVSWLSEFLRPVIRSTRAFLTRAEFREIKTIGADFSATDHWPSSP